jgi:hypothetical protein
MIDWDLVAKIASGGLVATFLTVGIFSYCSLADRVCDTKKSHKG